MSNQVSTKHAGDARRGASTIVELNDAARERRPGAESDSFDDLQSELSHTLAQLSDIVRRRTERATVYSQETIRQNPFTAVAIAAALGAAVGLIVTSSGNRRSSRSDWSSYVPTSSNFATRVHNELPTGKSLGRRLESLMDRIAEMDPKTVGLPAIRTAQELYGSFRDAVRSYSK